MLDDGSSVEDFASDVFFCNIGLDDFFPSLILDGVLREFGISFIIADQMRVRNLDSTLVSNLGSNVLFLISDEQVGFTGDSNGVAFGYLTSDISAMDINRTSGINKI